MSTKFVRFVTALDVLAAAGDGGSEGGRAAALVGVANLRACPLAGSLQDYQLF